MKKIIPYIKLILFWTGIIGCVWVSAQYEGFDQIFDPGKYHSGDGGTNDGVAIRNLLMNIFKNVAIIVFILAVIVAFVSVIRLLTSDN